MRLNISKLIEAIYLNAFTLCQNVELQIMPTWLHLSVCLLFVINLSTFKLINTETTVFRMVSVKHTNLKSPGKKIFFSLKKKKNEKEVFQLYPAHTQNLSFLQHQYDIRTLYGCWINVKKATGLMGNLVWRKIICFFFNQIKRTTPSET